MEQGRPSGPGRRGLAAALGLALLLLCACGEEISTYRVGDGPLDAGMSASGDGDGGEDGDGDAGPEAGLDAGPDAGLDAGLGAGPDPIDPIDPCSETSCGGYSFGDDHPDPSWLSGFSVIADDAALVGPDPAFPVASRYRDMNNLQVTADRHVLMWDGATHLQPSDNFLFQIGEVIELQNDVFGFFKRPGEMTAEIPLPNRSGDDELTMYAMDVRPGSNEVTVASDWLYKPDPDKSDTVRYMLIAQYGSGATLNERFRFVSATRMDWDIGDVALRVDAYGRIYIFDQNAARIIAPNGGVLLDVEGWYWSNSHGFAVDDNGVIFLNADDGGANQRMETVDRSNGDKTPLLTLDEFRAAASTYVGSPITPPFGRYIGMKAGILGATAKDDHTLIYAISAAGEIRFLADIGAGGFVIGFDYLADSGAMYILRDDANKDPEIIHNGR